jgi:hypothetical protein
MRLRGVHESNARGGTNFTGPISRCFPQESKIYKSVVLSSGHNMKGLSFLLIELSNIFLHCSSEEYTEYMQ